MDKIGKWSVKKIIKFPLYVFQRRRIATVGNIATQFAEQRFQLLDMDIVKRPLPKQQFYRRKLPDTCIDFSSPEGIRLFTEALPTGYMSCYFRLASQFSTQDEPAFCGLTTLVMILNSLEVDPGRVWKGPWRWYHENMLDCCVPLQIVQQDGITFDQFICLGNCNGIDTNAVRANSTASEEDFRKKVRECTRRDDCFLVCSYSRKILQQTGDGHFSPIGGYHPDQDMVLVLDTARFKYPPHWMPVSLLWESMKAQDQSTGEPRGYVTLSRIDQNPLLLLFRISPVFSISLPCGCTKEMSSFVESWQNWLLEVYSTGNPDAIVDLSNTDVLEALVKEAIQALQGSLNYLKAGQSLLTTQLDLRCLKDVSQQHKCAVHQLLEELEKSDLFQTVDKILNNDTSFTNFHKAGLLASSLEDSQVPEKTKCDVFSKIRPCHFVTVFLLCWPYNLSVTFKERTNAYMLNNLLPILSTYGQYKRVFDEVMLLRKQLDVMLTFYNKSKEKKCCFKS